MNNNLIDPRYLPSIRWDILRTCRMGGHVGATENMIREVVRSEWIGVTQNAIRDELHYLEDRDLVKIKKSDIYAWRITLTRTGYDIADYQVPCEEGIHRPPPAF